MKSQNNLMFIILILFTLIISGACKKQEAEWKGMIVEENGVTVVKNPKEPIHGEDVFDLEEELSIGEAEGEEEYIFSRIQGLGVDENDNIYVLDLKNFIRTFDPFMNLSVDEEGKIFVGTYEKSESENAYYFDVFDSEGRYIAKVPLKIEPFKPHLWRKNKLYSVEEDEEGFQMVKRYKVTWEN